jgi:hypothetical protein
MILNMTLINVTDFFFPTLEPADGLNSSLVGCQYTIQPNDTLHTIALSIDASLDAIQSINSEDRDVTDPAIMIPGEMSSLPVFFAAAKIKK